MKMQHQQHQEQLLLKLVRVHLQVCIESNAYKVAAGKEQKLQNHIKGVAG